MFRYTSRQREKRPDTIVPGPHKSVQYVAFNKARVAGKPDNIASLIDCRRRVPPLSSKVTDVGHPAVFPKHGMLGRMSSNRLVADARNAHDLTKIIDRRGGAGSVAGDQRQVMDLVWWPESPHGWAKLEDLGRDACVVFNAILRPAHHLTQVISSRGKTVISTRKIGKSPHLAVFQNESKIDIAHIV